MKFILVLLIFWCSFALAGSGSISLNGGAPLPSNGFGSVGQCLQTDGVATTAWGACGSSGTTASGALGQVQLSDGAGNLTNTSGFGYLSNVLTAANAKITGLVSCTSGIKSDASGNLSCLTGGGSSASTTLNNLGTTAVNANINMGANSVTFANGGLVTDQGQGVEIRGASVSTGNQGQIYLNASSIILPNTTAGDAGAIIVMNGDAEFRGPSIGHNVRFKPGGVGNAGHITVEHQSDVRLEGTTVGTGVSVKAAAATAGYGLILPAAQGGASTFLQNDGSGNLSWASGGGSSTGSANTVQLSNGSGGFTAATNLTYASNTLSFGASGGTINVGGGALALNGSTAVQIGGPGLQFTGAGVIYGPSGDFDLRASNDFLVRTGSTSNNLALWNKTGIKFEDGTPGNTIEIKPPTAITSSYSLKLPAAQGGAGTNLQNDGSGNLSWAAAGGGGGVGAMLTASITPGGGQNFNCNSAGSDLTFNSGSAVTGSDTTMLGTANKFTAQHTGWFLVTGNIDSTNTSGGITMKAFPYVNNSLYQGFPPTVSPASLTSSRALVSFTWTVYMTSSDQFSVRCDSVGGSNANNWTISVSELTPH